MDPSPRSPVVDISFAVAVASPLGGPATLPADHGFALFSAISHALPSVHANPLVAIQPFPGALIGDRKILLQGKPNLTFRAPSDIIGALLPLAGRVLDIVGTRLQIGIPSIYPLRPATRLFARLVVIKDMTTAADLFSAAERQAQSLGIQGKLAVRPRLKQTSFQGTTQSQDPYIRRTVLVRDKIIVGYAMEASELTAEDSIALQANGLGGRRRFGCGIFVPGGALHA